jgi:hypothetical protein
MKLGFKSQREYVCNVHALKSALKTWQEMITYVGNTITC